jgi:hypothetical protein
MEQMNDGWDTSNFLFLKIKYEIKIHLICLGFELWLTSIKYGGLR